MQESPHKHTALSGVACCTFQVQVMSTLGHTHTHTPMQVLLDTHWELRGTHTQACLLSQRPSSLTGLSERV